VSPKPLFECAYRRTLAKHPAKGSLDRTYRRPQRALSRPQPNLRNRERRLPHAYKQTIGSRPPDSLELEVDDIAPWPKRCGRLANERPIDFVLDPWRIFSTPTTRPQHRGERANTDELGKYVSGGSYRAQTGYSLHVAF